MVLSFEHISFRYRHSSRPVLDDFSWRVPGGRTVLLGPNGAGKSSLLALGADALRPARGRICFRGLEAGRRADNRAYRRAVGWMPQHVHAVPGLTVHEQVAYMAWLKGRGRREAWAIADEALARVDLTALAKRKVATLSGGQRRRVGLAQVLTHDAEILLLDEPTAGLDPAQRARLRELLAMLPVELTVVISTHQVDDLTELFDTVVVLEGGILRFTGSVPQFMSLAPETVKEHHAEAAYASIVSGER